MVKVLRETGLIFYNHPLKFKYREWHKITCIHLTKRYLESVDVEKLPHSMLTRGLVILLDTTDRLQVVFAYSEILYTV